MSAQTGKCRPGTPFWLSQLKTNVKVGWSLEIPTYIHDGKGSSDHFLYYLIRVHSAMAMAEFELENVHKQNTAAQ